MSNDPAKIISEALTITADELADLRDLIVNANKPVIDALGQVLKKLDDMQADHESRQTNVNEQIQNLRKAVFGGPSPAE